jgi:RHS repeat-associated protein
VGGSKTGETAKTYASSVEYTPHGGLKQLKLGNGLWEQWGFNARLQPSSIKLGSTLGSNGILGLQLEYGVASGDTCSSIQNNGNLCKQTISGSSFSGTQMYGYDTRNRLTSATETAAWSETYGYDRFGNRWVSARSGLPGLTLMTPTAEAWYKAEKNRIDVAVRTDWAYDLAGNVTAVANQSLQYDAEGRTKQVTRTVAGIPYTSQHFYDGLGQRVRSVNEAGAITRYLYNALGELVGENCQGPCGAVTYGTHYITPDWLGSTRAITSATGATVARYDYTPFGEQILSGYANRGSLWSANLGVTAKFTGKERDGETGLDYFGARYFSGAQGRFTSTDEPLNDQEQSDPQSWNLYSYVRNNPLRFIDPTGRECVTLDNGTTGDNGLGKMCQAVLDADKNKKPDVTVTDFEPPPPLLLAVAQGAQWAAPVTEPRFIAQFYGASVIGGGIGAGAALYAGTGLTTLSIGAARAATLAPLILPTGQKLAQVIARLGQGQQNPQVVLQKLTELRDAAAAAGTAVRGSYIQSGVTIYRVGQDYLTVSGQGKILSYVQNATPGTGVVQRYIELGGK